jgi:hypothetical protein
MILLNCTPCINCKYYDGVKYIGDKARENQYIACKKAENKKAENLLEQKKYKFTCEKYDEV